MKKNLSAVIVFTLTIFSTALAQPKVSLEQFVEQWLFDNCDVGEVKPENTLVSFGADAEALLIKALQQGPSDKQFNDLESALNKRWEKRRRVLESSDFQALSKEDLTAANKLTQNQYKEKEKNKFVLRYKDRAIQGLSYVGGKDAVAALEKLSAEKNTALEPSIISALKEIKEREQNNSQPPGAPAETESENNPAPAGNNTDESAQSNAAENDGTSTNDSPSDNNTADKTK